MALLDFLKNKKEAQPKGHSSKKSGKKSVKARYPSGRVKKEPAKEKVHYAKSADEVGRVAPKEKQFKKARNAKFSYEVIKQPHISEKAGYLAEKDQYVFEVSPNYNKNEIKNAIEGIYGVDVLSVNVIKIPSKKRRLGKTEGFRKAYKKAIVKIREGQKIEIL